MANSSTRKKFPKGALIKPPDNHMHFGRLLGRVKYILDRWETQSIVIPTMIGDVLIETLAENGKYRVGLLWPHNTSNLLHDYTISKFEDPKIDEHNALILDGLISAVYNMSNGPASPLFAQVEMGN